MKPFPTRPLIPAATLLAALLAPGLARAGILNGDFETGDFTGWTTDTDGGGAPSPLSPDFQVVAAPPISGAYSARLEADYWSIPGNTGSTAQDQVQISNTLFQGLVLSVTPGFELVLSFDWEFAGQETGTPDENVQIGLVSGGSFYDAAGNLGFLLTATSYGAGSFSGVLAPSFTNANGWSLDFQLNAGFNGYGSYLLIDNVSLTERPTEAPLPGTALLMAPVLGLLGLRRRARA